MRRNLLYENKLNRIIRETVRKVLNEGMYGYPDDLDQIVLAFENDSECMKMYENVLRALYKKARRGVELDVETLANSSVMKKLQSMALRKFKRYQDNFTRESYANLRMFIANKMLRDVEEGNYNF